MDGARKSHPYCRPALGLQFPHWRHLGQAVAQGPIIPHAAAAFKAGNDSLSQGGGSGGYDCGATAPCPRHRAGVNSPGAGRGAAAQNMVGEAAVVAGRRGFGTCHKTFTSNWPLAAWSPTVVLVGRMKGIRANTEAMHKYTEQVSIVFTHCTTPGHRHGCSHSEGFCCPEGRGGALIGVGLASSRRLPPSSPKCDCGRCSPSSYGWAFLGTNPSASRHLACRRSASPSSCPERAQSGGKVARRGARLCL